MDRFKKETVRYGKRLREEKCPMGDAELNRAIRHAIWQGPADSDTFHATATPAAKRRSTWPWVAAAACLAALLIPLTRTAGTDRRELQNGMTFVCNNGCQRQEILTRLDNIIK